MDEVGVPFGLNLHIELIATKERYTVKVVGCLPNKTLIVSAPRLRGKVVLLRETAIIKARFMMGTRVCAFASKVVKICRDPGVYFHISYPKEVESSVIREASRLETNLISVVEPIKHEGSIAAMDSGILVDLSLGGGRLISKNDFGYEKNRLNLAVKLDVAGINQVLKVKCQIRVQEIQSLEQIKSSLQYCTPVSKLKAEYLYVYGLKFEGLSNEKLILLTAYILEHRAVPG